MNRIERMRLVYDALCATNPKDWEYALVQDIVHRDFPQLLEVADLACMLISVLDGGHIKLAETLDARGVSPERYIRPLRRALEALNREG